MADIRAITLPDGTTYDISDIIARSKQLTATYTESTLDLALEFGTAENSDNEEF